MEREREGNIERKRQRQGESVILYRLKVEQRYLSSSAFIDLTRQNDQDEISFPQQGR